MREFRFGHQVRLGDPSSAIEEAKQAEAAGFDVLTAPDHVGAGTTSPMMLLAAAARETERIKLCPFVLNNEMRNPVQLAWDAATLDRLSDGRFELGLGAGHTPHEFAATGIEFARAQIRKRRLAESVEIIRRLLDGETVTYSGEYHAVEEATVGPTTQERVPILVGGNGDELLTHASQHADIIGLQGLGRTLEDGHGHEAKWSEEWLAKQIGTIHDHAGDRFDQLELNALVQMVIVTEDRQEALQAVSTEVETRPEELSVTPYLAVGTHAEIAAHFRSIRERWGISYFVTRDVDAMAPVIELLRGSS